MNSESSGSFNSSQSMVTTNLVFIDSAVEDYQSLVSEISPETELVILDSFRDGIVQIGEKLAQHQDLEGIHIVSHGQPGNIQLGNTELNLNTLNQYIDELQNWSNALTEEADILVYGCNVGANQEGEIFVDRLADITNADIAASTDLTGDAALGGDWVWEINTGTIESGLAFQTQAIQAYNQVFASEHQMMEHHNPLSYLAPHSQATHIAVKNGSWFDSSTWKNGEIPDNGADVLIPQGYRLQYNQESDARLDTLRVDGILNFAQGQNTKMLVDTFIVSPEGKLNIGNANRSVKANKTARIIFTSDEAVNTKLDSQQLSKGLVSHGKVGIYGAEKLDFTELKNDALAGDDELVLKLPNGMKSPTGWQVGDRLVLGGTYYSNRGSDKDNSRFHDEELTITAINGDRISFTNDDIKAGNNTVLRFDHQRPEGYKGKLSLYVANTTRNVTFESENGEATPIKKRGHVMFMHNPNVVVQNAGFYNLGRTDKTKLIDDPKQNVDGTIGRGTNVRGRYSLHFHRTGADNLNGVVAIAKGNAVVGSPGWGIAHHDSHARLEDNVVFDTVGAGIAAEAGNEIGTWRNNITIKITGDNNPDPSLTPQSPRVKRFDFGFNGDGYWVQGAGQVEMSDNIAISTAESGILHYGGGDGGQEARDAQTIPVANLPTKWRSIAKGTEDESEIDVAAVPLRKLSGFESYNSKRGIVFWAAMKNIDGQLGIDGTIGTQAQEPAHNFYSQVNNFQVWNVRGVGVSAIYSSQIELNNGLILGSADNTPRIGVGGNSAASQNIFNNLHIEGFESGLKIPLDSNRDYVGSTLKNSTFANNTFNLQPRNFESGQPIGYPIHFQMFNNNFQVTRKNSAPTAKFSTTAIGGLAIELDASQSFDSDSSEKNLPGKGITSYGWDLNNDGKIDRFGRKIDHYFAKPGSQPITLKVWDNQGATKTFSKTINVTQSPYKNLFIDGDFSSIPFFFKENGSTGANYPWLSIGNWSWNSRVGNGGAAVLTAKSNHGLAQVLLDNNIRRGQQTLSLDLKNIEGDNNDNQITVSVWGVNGEFDNRNWDVTGPQKVGSINMNRNKLLDRNLGGNNYDWNTFKWDLNFNNGYQFIVFQVNTEGVNLNQGDYVAIDNIKLK